MALENGYPFSAQTLPTPTEIPYDSPSMDISRRSSLRRPSSPSSDYSSVPFPLSQDSYFTKQQGTLGDGNVDRTSTHESRRFTPNNLGISLVAQIHSLRTELGGKDSTIEDLEECLHKSRAENEQLTKDLKTQKAEVTSVETKMQSLERDMLQALEDVGKERDNAVKSFADSRKRLEDSKTQARAQEEDANRAHALWEKDRQDWDDKKRKLEGRVHIVEERLKTMVTEMLIVQNADRQGSDMGDVVDEGAKDTWLGNGNGTSNIRPTFPSSNQSLDESCEGKGVSNFRSSRLSGLHGLGGSHTSGLSLAEELECDEGENAAEEENRDRNGLPEAIDTASRRYSEDEKAGSLMSFHADTREDPLGDETSGQHSMGIINDYIDFPGKLLGSESSDTGTQFSPPPSPWLQKQEPGLVEMRVEQTERTANQRRKRIAIPQIFTEQTLVSKAAEPKNLPVVSSGSQTVEQLENPASTANAANATPVSVPSTANEMRSASTQTIEDTKSLLRPASSRLSPSLMDVPVIAIHPPASRPSSSRHSVVLPPRTKNAACQVVIELLRNTKSTSMQTEETRISKRPLRIAPSLQSSNLSIQPLSGLAERNKLVGNILGPESSKRSFRNPSPSRAEGIQPSVTTATTARTKNAFPGNNDNGPLNHKQRSGPNRPVRCGSILAGFDVSSDDDRENARGHFSDDELLNAAPIRKTLSKVQNSWKLVPHLEDSVLERLESASEEAEDENRVSVPKAAVAKATSSSQTTSKTFPTRPAESYRVPPGNVKQPDIRRKALISSGIIEHAQRSRSPSESNVLGSEATIAPPFPVPTRSSSRNVPLGASDGAASPSPHTTTFSSAHHNQNYETPFAKRKMLRKVQSAAAVTQLPVPLRPQPTQSSAATPTVPPSPKLPAPRRNQFILPYDSVADLPSHSAPPQLRAGNTSVETPSEQSSVVDTIAQTMVGEWMWKYVRGRISFGMTESPQTEFGSGRNGDNGNGNGVRHKRWVWLAPFEQAVMWSNKQPLSGPALQGKGARKLTIQSVLDVKDDTPLPKNADSQAIFDRSILILTPRRALKFTARSRERHYIWLTALSYLSNSTQGIHDLALPTPLHKEEYHYLSSKEPMIGFRRTPIRDSIDTARVKARPSIGVHSYSSPIGLVEQQIIEEAKLPWEDEEADSDDAAEPPQVHRVTAHARKRSSTGPRSVPLSTFQTYPRNALAVASSCSLQGATSREKYDRYTPQPQIGSLVDTTHGTLTRGITNRSITPSPIVPDNFFDCGGTVRMEAFVEGKEKEYVFASRVKRHRRRQGRKKDMSFWGFDAPFAGSGLGSARLEWEDPFTGF